MAGYDTAIADGRGNMINRLAQSWFPPLSRVRQQMEAFCSSTLSMESYPLLCIALQGYALLAIVERRIERVHGVLKRIGVHAFGVSLPQLCAMVREEQSLELLQRSAEFSEYCVKTWHSRTLLDQILVLRYRQEDLKKLSFKTKLGMVYRCSLSEEFQDVSEHKVGCQEFLMLTAGDRPKPDQVTDDERLCLSWLKSLLPVGSYFSMAREHFEAALADTTLDDDDGHACRLDVCLAAVDETTLDYV